LRAAVDTVDNSVSCLFASATALKADLLWIPVLSHTGSCHTLRRGRRRQHLALNAPRATGYPKARCVQGGVEERGRGVKGRGRERRTQQDNKVSTGIQ
jgi:hypothetical protein